MITKREYADFLAREALRATPTTGGTPGYDDDYGQDYWGSVAEDDWDYGPAADKVPSQSKWHNDATIAKGLANRVAAQEQARLASLNSQVDAMKKLGIGEWKGAPIPEQHWGPEDRDDGFQFDPQILKELDANRARSVEAMREKQALNNAKKAPYLTSGSLATSLAQTAALPDWAQKSNNPLAKLVRGD